jgi:tRNA dimethylallyltransferase
LDLPEVPPNAALRKRLEKKSAEALFAMLKKLDPKRAGNIDRHNKVRLVRAIEIAKALGRVPPVKHRVLNKWQMLQIGLNMPLPELQKRISIRLFARIRDGMIDEARKLHKNGLSWKRMEELGLEYKYLALYLQNKISKEQMTAQLNTAISQYARRQMTWFKRDKDINWFNPMTRFNLVRINKLVEKFLKK